MPMETPKDKIEVDLKDIDLYEMKIELMAFLDKMKSNGFLESVEFRDSPFGIKQI